MRQKSNFQQKKGGKNETKREACKSNARNQKNTHNRYEKFETKRANHRKNNIRGKNKLAKNTKIRNIKKDLPKGKL